MTVFNSRNSWFKSSIGPVTLEEKSDKSLFAKLCLKICLGNRNVKSAFIVMEQMIGNERKINEIPMKKITIKSTNNIYKVDLLFIRPASYEYYFKFTDEKGTHFIRKEEMSFEGVVTDWIEKEPWILTVYKKLESSFKMQSGIMYQIFPDRFYKGKSSSNLPEDRWYRKWGEVPCYTNDYSNNRRGISRDFFGGNFAGMQEKIDYLKKMHISVVYSNPICMSSTNHRYAAIDYKKVDPVLGTEEEFKTLIDAYHRAGIIFILDVVFNHMGSDSIYFDRYNEHNSDGAYQSEQSKYRDWFYIGNNYQAGYECWWGDPSLPKLNYKSESLNEYLFGRDGVMRYWYQKWEIDGIREDVADELPNHIRDEMFRISDEERGKNKVIIPEVWEDASKKWAYSYFMEYMQGNQATSVMNYPVKEMLLAYVRYGGDYWAGRFEKTCYEIFKENYPREIAYSLMNFLSTHDTVRAITKLAGPEVDDKSREWQAEHTILSKAEYKLGRKRLMLAYLVTFFLPGIPSIYYGDEIGMQGMKDPFCRMCFTWNRIDKKILHFFKRLCATRTANSKFLANADFDIICCESSFLAFERTSDNEKIRLFLNFSDEEKDITDFFTSYSSEGKDVYRCIEKPQIIFQIKNSLKDKTFRESRTDTRIVLSGHNGIVVKAN